jgi:hypothetical protein
MVGIFSVVQPTGGVAAGEAACCGAPAGIADWKLIAADQFFKLDTSTGLITNYGIEGPDYNGNAYLRNVISSDNSEVFFNDDGELFSIDTATDTPFYALNGYTCCYGNYELALASDQTQLTGTDYLYDSNLNAES